MLPVSTLNSVKERGSNGAFTLYQLSADFEWVVPGNNLQFQKILVETELHNYARDHLAHLKCPQRIQFVSELPKTATGKVQKYVLRGKPAISKQ
jgi:acyl-CoA synthetase (AMP-forming)/AMP-acid ligase II